MTDKEIIIEMLSNVNRDGMPKLLTYLDESGFYTSPASTKYHGCYHGGLAVHSLKVFGLVVKFNEQFRFEVSNAEIAVACLLHDVCKIGAYLGGRKPYTWNREQPKGHAKLSLERIKKYILLTENEELMIKYHMGVYGLNEFEERSGEYPLRSAKGPETSTNNDQSLANAWYHYPITKLMYFCDELATFSEKAAELEIGE